MDEIVHEGDVILTYAGAGGVGLILTQLLKLKGATVITTASTQEKKDLAKAAGADYVVDYDQVADTVEKVTGGKGVNAVYDGIGKDTFETSLAALRRRGTLVLFGGASGQVPPTTSPCARWICAARCGHGLYGTARTAVGRPSRYCGN